MKASEIVARLSELIENCGDKEVAITLDYGDNREEYGYSTTWNFSVEEDDSEDIFIITD